MKLSYFRRLSTLFMVEFKYPQRLSPDQELEVVRIELDNVFDLKEYLQ